MINLPNISKSQEISKNDNNNEIILFSLLCSMNIVSHETYFKQRISLRSCSEITYADCAGFSFESTRGKSRA